MVSHFSNIFGSTANSANAETNSDSSKETTSSDFTISSSVEPSNRNALVHGVYASELVLPWESSEDLQRLHADLRMEFNPNGRLEEETVLDIVRLIWLNRRVMRMSQIAAYRDPLAVEMNALGRKSWDEIFRDLNEGSKKLSNSKLIGVMSDLKVASERLGDRLKSGDSDVAKAHDDINSIQNILRLILPSLPEKLSDPNEAFVEWYSPEKIEKLVKLEAAIDVRITKATARLISLQEYKRLKASRHAPAVAHSSGTTSVLAPE